MAEKETAFVLPEEAVPGASSPVHFGGFPGAFTPGVPISVSALGFDTLKDARAAAQGLPLRETKVDIGAANPALPENHLLNTEQARAAGQQETAVETPEAMLDHTEPTG